MPPASFPPFCGFFPSFPRIVREYVKKFGLRLRAVLQSDGNAWYLVHNIRKRVKDVEEDPSLLRYPVTPSERGKTAEQLYQEALHQVHICL